MSAKKKSPKGDKKKNGKSHSPSLLRKLARYLTLALLLAFASLCTGGYFYVHHSPEWLRDHRGAATFLLEYLGDRTTYLTDGLGWTGHDAVYDYDEESPLGEKLFAGAPRRVSAPAPADVVTLERGEFVIGWSPSLRHPVWAAYHVPAQPTHEAGRRPAFKKDASVDTSPIPGDYTHALYDRGHMVPNRAMATRFGPDIQKKTFLMTNIAPQRPALNRGPWRELEQRICDLWTAKYGEIWVIVGAISSTSPSARETLSNTHVDVPEKYYMLITAQTKDGVRALAILLDHQSAGYRDFPVHSIVTIEELEKATGYEFLPDLPKFLKSPLKVDRPTRLWPVRFADIIKLILIRFV